MTDALTREMIEELRGLAEKATPGPWDADFNDGEYGWQPRIAATDGRLLCVVGNAETERQDQWEANAALIVATINALPALLDLATASLAGASATPGQRINGLNDALAFAQGDTSRARVASAETRVHPDATSPGVTAGASAGDDGRSATGLEHPPPQEGRVSVGDEELCKRLEQHSEWHCDDGTIDRHYRNPDGPEAASRLRSQAREIEALMHSLALRDATIEKQIPVEREARVVAEARAEAAESERDAALAKVGELEKALEPFASFAEYMDGDWPKGSWMQATWPGNQNGYEYDSDGASIPDDFLVIQAVREFVAANQQTLVYMEHFRRARTALHGREKDNG